MATMKMLHVLFMIIWVGNLLALTRLLGYHVKQTKEVQLALGNLYFRMYYFVGLPSLVITVTLGIILLMNKTLGPNPGWFHMKLTLAVLLIGCDFITGKWIRPLRENVDTTRGVKYKILHGVCGLLLIGILFSIYVLKKTVA